DPLNNSFHVVFAEDGTDDTAILEGFVITQGYAENGIAPHGRGGGIHARFGGVFRECYIVDNYAENGGGVYTYKGGTFEDCTIETNIAQEDETDEEGKGGGVYVNLGGVFTNCIIHSNQGFNGGGVYTEHSLTDPESKIPQFINCAMGNNQAKNKGGGIFILNGGEIMSCLVANNEVPDANQEGESGGIHLQEGGEVVNCTVVNNHCYEVGTGIAIDDGADNTPQGPTLAILNTFLWGNTQTFFGVANQFHPASKVEYLSYCAIQDYTPGESDTNIGLDAVNATGPMFYQPTTFAGLATNETQLDELVNSDWGFGLEAPGLNAGDPTTTGLPATDFEDNPRVVKEIVDIGAIETLYYTITPSATGAGTIVPSVPTNVLFNGALDIVLTPDDGYGRKVATDNGGDISEEINESNTYALTNISKDHIIVVEYALEYSVNVTVGENGSVDKPNENIVVEGKDFELIITPDPGFEISTVTDNGPVDPNDLVDAGEGKSSYTIESIAENHDVNVTFAVITALKHPELQKVALYPNPTADRFFINGVEGKVSIYNHLGQLIKKVGHEEARKGVKVMDLNQGIYLVECSAGGKMKVFRLVVRK
ncbi:MAG: T9SS type A sorting domain-containing protein, partial [Marinilabiliaceae bacterium]|nr:T9SS type A sorting domain-containing protein [Marinilabiliaceae bacterium]